MRIDDVAARGLAWGERAIQDYRLYWLIACLLLVLSSQASFSQCAHPPSTSGKILNYSLQPFVADGKMTLHVTLEFKGGSEGKAELELPSEWAGQTHLEKAVTGLKAISDETTISDTASPSRKSLRFTPNATVRISCSIRPKLNPRGSRAERERRHGHVTQTLETSRKRPATAFDY